MDALHPTVADAHLSDPCAEPDLGAVMRSARGQRSGYSAHASAREAPLTELALELAPGVMSVGVRGARSRRATPDRDHAEERHVALDMIGLEVLVEQILGRQKDELVEQLLLAGVLERTEHLRPRRRTPQQKRR